MNSIKQKAIAFAGDHLVKVLTDNKFSETGLLTPEEFVAAGDHLVYHCPTWQWAVGDPAKIKNYLPADKQFLTTKSVPCYRRIKQVLGTYDAAAMEQIIDSDADPEGGWVATHGTTGGTQDSGNTEETIAKTSEMLPVDSVQELDQTDDDDNESLPPCDLEDFVNEAQIEDPDPYKASGGSFTATAVDSGAVEQVRTYDLYITYDNFYHTPRMWLVGYSENKKLLTQPEMFADISEDHADKTVTMESHPHLPGQVTMASIHPCRHAEVMKRLVQAMSFLDPSAPSEAQSQSMGVHLYLIVFLKFMQAVIPTIEYDFTRDVKMS